MWRLLTLIAVPLVARANPNSSEFEYVSCDVWNEVTHGECVHVDSQGQLTEKTRFYFGVLHGPQVRYGSHGQILEEVSYRFGVLQGPWKEFHTSGTPALLAQFEQGELEGPVLRYDALGNRRVVSDYRRGRRDGLETYYWPNGYVAGRSEYLANGAVISRP